MNEKEISMEVVRIIKSALFKSFFIGFILLIVMSIAYHFNFDGFYNMSNNFYPMDEATFTNILVMSIAMWKLILLQLFLIPAIALHFTIKCCEKKHE